MLPAHLMALPPAADWAIWRWACLRSAGFPAARISALSNPACAAVADRLNELRDTRESIREAALDLVRSGLDALRQRGEWNSPAKAPLLAAMSHLQPDRKLPEAAPGPLGDAIEALRRADADVEAAQAAYDRAWAAAERRTADGIQQLVRDDRFSEAIVWQNREAYHNVVVPLRSHPGDPRNKSRRRREKLVARYAQRYCAKNDSIGFFGPISWATFQPDGPALAVDYGPGLLRERRLYVEQWGVDALADVIAALPGIQPWCAPRRLPFAHLSDGTLHLTPAVVRRLSPAQAAVLAGCTGRRTARDLAGEVVAMGEPGLSTEDEVYGYLDHLRSQGLITWTIEVSFTTHPDRALACLLERIGDDAVRTRAERVLDVYRSAVLGVRDAAGTVERLDASLARLESVFSRLTSKAAVRGHGRMYAARAVVYEDGLRDVDVRVGPDLLRELAAPLTLLLQSARWLTATAADRARQQVHDLYRQLRRDNGAPAVSAAQLWQALPAVFPGLGKEHKHTAPFVTELQHEFHRRWLDVLGAPDPAGTRVHRSSTDLRPRVAELFAASRPGWHLARHHSPDLFLAATDDAAVRRGEFLFVLGEMHLANNTMAAAAFVDQHPHPEQLPGFMATDLPEPVVTSVVPRQWRGVTSSTRDALCLHRDWHLLMSPEFVPEPGPPEAQQIAIGEMIIEEVDGQLRARTYDRRFQQDVMELLGGLMSINVIDSFTMFPVGEHTPRITIDRLVVQREAWRVRLDGLAGVLVTNEAQQFAALRGWARELGIPDHIFLAISVEDKPIFVDLTSPILVAAMVKALRRGLEHAEPVESFVVSEMLPDLADTWLGDREGNHYTSEFRTVVVDLAGRDDIPR